MHTFFFLPFVILFAAPLLVQSSAAGSQIQNDDPLESLRTQLDMFRVQMNHLQEKNAENEEKIAKQEEKIIKLLAKNDVQKGNSAETFGEERAPIVPSSCSDLSAIGYTLNGFYSVRNTQINKIQTVYCIFGTPVFQQLIGSEDIKTKSVHFYVQRNTTFTTQNAIIPFELARLNEGEAMELASGIFVAPVYGLYHFEFSGLRAGPFPYSSISLQVNGQNIGVAHTYPPNPLQSSRESHSLTASLILKRGVKVNLYNSGESVVSGFYTHFTGWLEEEYLKF